MNAKLINDNYIIIYLSTFIKRNTFCIVTLLPKVTSSQCKLLISITDNYHLLFSYAFSIS